MPLAEFASTTFIIMDDWVAAEPDPDDSDGDGDTSPTTPHQKKVNKIRNFVENYTYATVEGVIVPSNQSVNHAIAEVRRIVGDKTAQDNIILYYEGSTGFSGDKWRWKWEGNTCGWFNAFDLLGVLAECPAHVCLIVDGEVCDRVQSEHKQRYRNVEIFGPKHIYKDPDGDYVGLQHDYTFRLIKNLKNYVKHIDTKHKGAKEPRTIPQIMAKDYELRSNSCRIEPKAGVGLLIDPRQIKTSVANGEKKIKFCHNTWTSLPDAMPVAPQPPVVAEPADPAPAPLPAARLIRANSVMTMDSGFAGSQSAGDDLFAIPRK